MHNMADAGSSTRVTYRKNPNFLERIGSSLAGILVGIALIGVSCYLIFWNEGRAVQTAKSLEEGLNSVVPLGSADVVFDKNNGKLVHLTGPLQTDKFLFDDTYNVAVHAVKLRRSVDMFQWVEEERKREVNEGSQTREETTYSYSTEWKSELVRSSSFYNPNGHHNPESMYVSSQQKIAPDPQVGSFFLSSGLIGSITNYRKLIPQENPKDVGVKLLDGVFYHSQDPMHPEVGDFRVTFEYAGRSGKESAKLGPPDVVSIIARQLKHSLIPYQTNAGDSLEILYIGDLTAQQIFAKEQSQNAMLTWALRGAGWLLMFIGFSCMTSIVNTLVDWLPIVREIVNFGMATLNFSLSLSLSLAVIALGWIRYRPLLGVTILALAATPFVLSYLRRGKKKNRTA